MDYTYCSGPSPAESPLKQLLKGHVIIEMSESTLQSSFGCETYAPVLSSNWDSMTYLIWCPMGLQVQEHYHSKFNQR